MARFRGFGLNVMTLDGVETKTDTLQCCHCNTTMFLDPKTPSPWCWHCDSQHCFKPGCFTCTPFMQKIEAEEARDLAKRRLWQAADNT